MNPSLHRLYVPLSTRLDGLVASSRNRTAYVVGGGVSFATSADLGHNLEILSGRGAWPRWWHNLL